MDSFNFEHCKSIIRLFSMSHCYISTVYITLLSSLQYKPDSFVSRCMADYCLALEKHPGDIDLLSELVCEVYDQYSFLCGREGIFFDWRNEKLCRKSLNHLKICSYFLIY